jgi:hypothetical protein
MKNKLAKIAGASALPLVLALVASTPAVFVGCGSTGSTTNVVTSPVIGTNGVVTVLLENAMEGGIAFGLYSSITHSPQHAAAIVADANVLVATLQQLQGTGNVTPAEITAVLNAAKVNLTTAEAQLLVPVINGFISDAVNGLTALGLPTVPYMPTIIADAIVGIQTGIAAASGSAPVPVPPSSSRHATLRALRIEA